MALSENQSLAGFPISCICLHVVCRTYVIACVNPKPTERRMQWSASPPSVVQPLPCSQYIMHSLSFTEVLSILVDHKLCIHRWILFWISILIWSTQWFAGCQALSHKRCANPTVEPVPSIMLTTVDIQSLYTCPIATVAGLLGHIVVRQHMTQQPKPIWGGLYSSVRFTRSIYCT